MATGCPDPTAQRGGHLRRGDRRPVPVTGAQPRPVSTHEATADRDASPATAPVVQVVKRSVGTATDGPADRTADQTQAEWA